MADFEGLIQQALASQNANDAVTRQKIYQSSRNALTRMLQKMGNQSEDAIYNHFSRLENSIAKIEKHYVVETPAVNELPVVSPVATAPEAKTESRVDIPDLVSPKETSQIDPAPPRPTVDEKAKIEPIDELVRILEAASGPVSPAPAPTQTAPVQRSALHQQPPIQNSLNYSDQVQAPRTTPSPIAQPAPAASAPPAPQYTRPQQPDFSKPEPVVPPAPSFTQPRSPATINEASFDGANRGNPQNSQDLQAPRTQEPFLGDIIPTFDEKSNANDADVSRGNEADLSRIYKRKNPLLRRIWPLLLAIAVVLVILWILYALFATRSASPTSLNNQPSIVAPVGTAQKAADGSIYITLLEPTDLSSMVTAGRGTAELVTESNQQMLRLQSVRQSASQQTAEPILLEIEKGVLQQIIGKDATIEFLAKSGSNEPAQFSVECSFGDKDICGRKRFRVGLQPELNIFSLDTNAIDAAGEKAYLKINTDITTEATSKGIGELVDLVHVRIRMSDK